MDSVWKTITFLLATAGAYVAYQQFRLSKEKFKLDLFEKRFAVFAGVRSFLSEILREGRMKDYNPLFAFRAATAEASFLFGEDVTSYIDEIDKRALKMHSLNIRYQSNQATEDRPRNLDEATKELEWLIDQLPLLKVKFAPYLKFEQWH